MKLAVHLLHPIQSPGIWVKMRCGLTRNKITDKYIASSHPEEVTCIKCKSYINNPWRSLRQYGKLFVIENESAALAHDWGYCLDIIVVNEHTGTWTMVVGKDGKRILHASLPASSMAELGAQLLRIYEQELIKKAR